MRDAIRSFDTMSRHRRDQAKDVNEAEEALYQDFGRLLSYQRLHKNSIFLSQSIFIERTIRKHYRSICCSGEQTKKKMSLVELLEDNGIIDALDVLLDEEFRTQCS